MEIKSENWNFPKKIGEKSSNKYFYHNIGFQGFAKKSR